MVGELAGGEAGEVVTGETTMRVRCGVIWAVSTTVVSLGALRH